MARFFAIDWDDAECRYLLASVQKGSITVQKSGSVPLEMSDEELPALVGTLQHVIKEERIDPCPTLLCLGRNKVEMLYQTLPPCKETEVPILLKNQVLREHSGFTDFDPLDYLELGDDAETGHSLLALTIPLSMRQALVRQFRSIGRAPQSIGFRAVAAAGLIDADLLAEEKSGLVVNVVGHEVDLVFMVGCRIKSIRSFRLPEQFGFAQTVNRIGEEIQRTVAVEADGESETSAPKVFLFGDKEDWTPLVEFLASRKWEATIVNPFKLSYVTAAAAPELPGRFAPLLGMLAEKRPEVLVETAASRVDFLHPREAPKPTNYVRVVLLVLFLLGLAGYGLYHWNQAVVRGMETELTRLENEYKEVATQYQQVQPIWNVLRQTRSWDTQSVVWLDELRELSVVLPGEQDLVVSNITFTTGPINNDHRISGMIQLSGMVRDPSVLMTLQKNLQAKGYQMRYPAPSVNPAGGGYPWLFRTSILRWRR